MVIVELDGGLGNQLFQYAFARNIAYKLNTELKLDLRMCNKNSNSHHAYYKLDNFNIQENFAGADDFANITGENWKIWDTGIKHIQPNDNVFIRGHWMQSEPFFMDIADIIRHELTLKNPIGEISSIWEDKILSAECAVSLHVRLCDYLLPQTRNTDWGKTLSLDYYKICVAELKKFVPNMTLFVFSDDIALAKKILKFDVPMEFVDGCEHDFEEMYLISLCKHNIMVNSTFSFWGSWLNGNPNKKIFAPSNYAAIRNCMLVNVDSMKNPLVKMPPALSIIVYVDNDIPKCQLAILSILSQNIRDYEIIILDSETDDSEKIYRQFAINDNVTFIKIAPDVGKTSALNIGMDCARGDYILFLNGGDFIVSNAVQLFLRTTADYFNKYVVSKGVAVTYDTYQQSYIGNMTDIICFIGHIEEDSNGSLQINGVPNRKFQILVDVQFKQLNELQEFSFNDEQKMILLATKQLNDLLGTKFFKRSFLNEQRIRFNERKQGGVLS